MSRKIPREPKKLTNPDLIRKIFRKPVRRELRAEIEKLRKSNEEKGSES